MSGAVWRDDRNGPRERARAETLSQGLGGGIPPDFAGPGRYLGSRNPVPAYARRDPKTHPGSEAVDDALRGDQPVITYQDTDADPLPAGQLYAGPARADIRRDRGTAQLAGAGIAADHSRASKVNVPPQSAPQASCPPSRTRRISSVSRYTVITAAERRRFRWMPIAASLTTSAASSSHRTAPMLRLARSVRMSPAGRP